MKTKICPRCKEIKNTLEFSICRIRKDGLQVYCKKCERINRSEHKVELKEYHADYYIENKEKIHKDYLENREKYLLKAIIYRKEHPDKIKKYREEHKEQLIQKSKNYNIKNKDKIRNYNLTSKGVYNRLKATAKSRNIYINITEEAFINWYNNQDKKCYYCNRTLEELKQDIREENKHKDKMSIDRKNNNEGYILENMVLACTRCNIVKGNYFTEQEMLRIGKTLYRRGIK